MEPEGRGEGGEWGGVGVEGVGEGEWACNGGVGGGREESVCLWVSQKLCDQKEWVRQWSRKWVTGTASQEILDIYTQNKRMQNEEVQKLRNSRKTK